METIFIELKQRSKNKQSVKTLVERLKNACIDTRKLNEKEVNDIIACFLIASR